MTSFTMSISSQDRGTNTKQHGCFYVPQHVFFSFPSQIKMRQPLKLGLMLPNKCVDVLIN